jgi:hypothetical protein
LRARGKPGRGFRIVGLGDSVMFGWGVPFEATSLAVLEQRLQQACPGHVVEAINTAVPGYNTAMQARVLREKGIAYAPDVVIVDFVGNDFDLPNFLWQQPDYWRLDRSYLLDLVRRSFAWREAELHGPFVHAPIGAHGGFLSDPELVPAQYRHLVGAGAYRRALEAMADMARAHGFRLIVSCHHDLPALVRACCDELGLPYVQIGQRVGAWLRDHGHSTHIGSPLTISGDDPHPTAIVHELWATAALETLRELEWLPR